MNYKEVHPRETVSKIRNILQRNDIFVAENSFGKDESYYSCRVKLCETDKMNLLNIGQNGKGMSFLYSLASGYAEFMERLQNRVMGFEGIKYASRLFMQQKNYEDISILLKRENIKPLPFVFCPDEKLIEFDSREDFIRTISVFCPNSFSNVTLLNNSCNRYKTFFAPFYDVFTSKVIQLPIEIIKRCAGTTGMCAGNSFEEAILQGIFEIFERYVLQLIYTQNIVFPQINPKSFAQTDIINKLNRLEGEIGVQYTIIDCRTSLNLPVIGLYLYDKNNDCYAFRVAAELDYEVALERCYTEIFQGYSNDSSAFVKIKNSSIENAGSEFLKMVEYGNGYFSISSVSQTDIRIIEIKSDKLCTNSTRLKYVLQHIYDLNYDIYIRDVSYLGFPTYHIYIPGLSDVKQQLVDLSNSVLYHSNSENFFSVNPLYRLNSITEEEIRIVISRILNSTNDTIALFPYNVAENNIVNKHFLLTCLYYKIREWEQSYLHFELFIEEFIISNEEIPVYYLCVKDFIKDKKDNVLITDIRNRLVAKYDREIVDEVINDLSDSDNIFSHFETSQCFNCGTCQICDNCLLGEILKHESKMQQKYMSNIINQSSLKDMISWE